MRASRRVEPDGRSAFDVTAPSIARVYDFWLGGKDNFAADRAEAERLIGIYPQLPLLARENKAFLVRAVTWLAQQGIRQFLDIGSGLPAEHNIHQAAQVIDSSCRVVYADNDPLVVSHMTARLSGNGVTAVEADLADPAALTANPTVVGLINPDRPTGLILALVLHFFDASAAEKIVADLVSWLAPGSCVVISVISGDETTGGTLTREYRAGPLRNHLPEQITAFLSGLDLVQPGLVDAKSWQPDMLAVKARQHQGARILAAVARKPLQAVGAPPQRRTSPGLRISTWPSTGAGTAGYADERRP